MEELEQFFPGQFIRLVPVNALNVGFPNTILFALRMRMQVGAFSVTCLYLEIIFFSSLLGKFPLVDIDDRAG